MTYRQVYSKGDTVKFTDGRMSLVLNDGMTEHEFKEQYQGQWVSISSLKGVGVRLIMVGSPRTSFFWYNILVGDENMWINSEIFYYMRYGKLPQRRE